MGAEVGEDDEASLEPNVKEHNKAELEESVPAVLKKKPYIHLLMLHDLIMGDLTFSSALLSPAGRNTKQTSVIIGLDLNFI